MDRRKRLQVLNQSNPSLRVSVAPAQKLAVRGSNNTQTLRVGNQEITRDNEARTAPRSESSMDNRNPVASIADVVSKPFRPFGEGLARMLPGGQADLKAIEEQTRGQQENIATYTQLRKEGKISPVRFRQAMDEINSGATSTARDTQNIEKRADRSQALGSAVYTAAAPLAAAGFGAKTAIGTAVGEGVIGAGFGVLNQVATNAKPTFKGAAKEAGVGAVLGGSLPIVGGVVGRVANKFKSSKAKKIIDTLTNTVDIETTAKILNKQAPELEGPALRAAADALAKETDPSNIEAIIGIAKDPELAQLDGVYSAFSPDPRSLPEGMQPPRQEGGPNANRTDEEFRRLQQDAIREAGGEVGDTTPAIERGYGQKPEKQNPEDAANAQAVEEYNKAIETGTPAYERGYGKPADLTDTIKTNAQNVKGNPHFDEKMQQAFLETGIQDPYNLIINTLSRMSNKGDVRDAVTQLMGGRTLDSQTLNRLTSKLTNAKTAREVQDIIDAETAKSAAVTPSVIDPETAPFKTADAPVTPAAQVDEAVEAMPAQSGTAEPANVFNSETASVETPGRQFNASDEGVAEQVNRSADEAVKQSSGFDPSKPADANNRPTTVEDYVATGMDRQRAEKLVETKANTKALNDAWAGRKYNEGMNVNVLTEEDNRLNKSLPGITRVKQVTAYKDVTAGRNEDQIYRKPTVVTEIVDDPSLASTTGQDIKGPKAQRAEDVLPADATPEDRAAVQAILDELSPAQRAYNANAKTRSQDKATRAARGEAAYQAAGGGEAGVKAKLAQLRGEYTKSGYTPISLDPKVEANLLDSVEKSNLRPFEKLNTQNALRKVWGASQDKPLPSDIGYIRKYFNGEYGEGVGDELAKNIDEALKEDQTWKDVAAKIAGLPRALMATGDLSGGFRQAMPLGTRYPVEWAKANAESVKYALKPKYYEDEMKKLADSDSFELITSKLGVDLPGAGAGLKDEGFMAAEYAEMIPLYGKLAIKPAERAYQGVLTKLRYDATNNMIEKAGGVDAYLKHMDELYGDQADDAMRAYGEVINTLSGRGGQKGGLLDQHMQTAATLLFAPRLWFANLQRLNPFWYANLYKKNPEAAKLALRSQATFLMTAGTVLGIAARSGAEVGTDPRSADFGKIKVGNTRYDILGGQQQNIVQLARQWTGEKVKSDTGEVDKIGDEYGEKNRFDLAMDMFSNKANPLLGFAIRLGKTTDDPNSDNPLMKKDNFGEKFNIATEVGKLGVPLGVQGAADLIGDTGNVPKSLAMNAPSFVGVGVQTYGKTATKDQGKPASATSKSLTERIAAEKLSDKTKLDAYKKTLNEDEKALLDADKDLRERLLNDGTVTQEQMDRINEIEQELKNSKGIDMPKGIKSKLAKDFYTTYLTKTPERQKAWLDEKPDETAKSIATKVNAERVEGLDEFKPSNKLAKLYADYEKDLNENKDKYTELDLRDKSKKFQKDAYKLNYTLKQQDLYSQASDSEKDIDYFIEQGKVDKNDLDAAIKMDNDLYNSGLNGSLIFSKTFRGNYGYGMPTGGKGNKSLAGGGKGGSGGGSGGGKGDETPRTGINELLPNFKLSSMGGDKPEMSKVSRTTKMAFKSPDLPSKSGKKITIRL